MIYCVPQNERQTEKKSEETTLPGGRRVKGGSVTMKNIARGERETEMVHQIETKTSLG
jgi:hypothetical protein